MHLATKGTTKDKDFTKQLHKADGKLSDAQKLTNMALIQIKLAKHTLQPIKNCAT